MPLLNSIATPYAEAFLQVAEKNNETDQVVGQVRAILALWNSSPELRQAMGSPVIEPAAKKAAVTRLFSADASPSLINLLKLLADRNRINVLDAVLERFLELYRDLRHIALATVTSASPLSEDQQAALSQKVKAVAGTDNVEFNLKVDPALIGGFVVSLGSQVIDASLAGQVRRLGLALAKAS